MKEFRTRCNSRRNKLLQRETIFLEFIFCWRLSLLAAAWWRQHSAAAFSMSLARLWNLSPISELVGSLVFSPWRHPTWRGHNNMLVQYNLNVVCKGQGHHPLLLPRDAAFNVVESLPIQFLFWYSVLDFQKQSKIGTLSSFLHLKINRQTSKLIVTMLLKRHASM